MNSPEQISSSLSDYSEPTGIDLKIVDVNMYQVISILERVLVFGVIIFCICAFFVVFRTLLIWRGQGANAAANYLGQSGIFLVNILKKWISNVQKIVVTGYHKLGKWKMVIFGCVVVLVVGSGLFRFNIVDFIKVEPGQVGINIANNKHLQPGVHLVSPIFGDYILAQLTEYHFNIQSISAESSELQDVIIDIDLGFRLDPDMLMDFYTQNGVKSIWDVAQTAVTPKSIETIKEVVRQYSFKDVQKKTIEVKSRSLAALKEAFKDSGILIEDINIINIAISNQYAELEKEHIATQRELELAKREAEGQIIRAEGIRKSNDLIAGQRISPESLKQQELALAQQRLAILEKFIEKWNGTPPNNVGGDFLPAK